MGEPRVSSSGTTAQLSAKIMEAQVYFQKVVKHELQVLVASGLEREVAVKMLLRRIVQSTYEPEESDVRRVMRQFQMIHDDAVRALIVKQEIGRLKRQGLDAFAAIELLTRKMQGISVPDHDGDEEGKEQETKEQKVTNEEMSDLSSSAVAETITEKFETDEPQARTQAVEDGSQTKEVEEPQLATSAAMESTEPPSQDSSSLSSLSLCERIDQVSISATPPDDSQPGNAASPPSSPALSTTHTTPRSAYSLFSAHSRKRRVTSGTSSPLNDVEDTPLSPHISVTGSSTSSSHRSHFSVSRPLSPTFRFPMNKKQKIWTDEANDEPVLDSISIKEASIPPPASPTGVGTASENMSSTVTATPTRMGKRRRSIRAGSSSPELDEIDVEDPLLRVAKRHKL